MKKLLINSLILTLCMGIISCASYMEKYYKGSRKMHFYHGAKLPDVFVSIVDSSSKEIEFKIRMKTGRKYLYHIIINEEEEERISEGWFPTLDLTNRPDHYNVRMKAKKGFNFQSGKKYHLCVGLENPDMVYYSTGNYKCIVYYEFILPQK